MLVTADQHVFWRVYNNNARRLQDISSISSVPYKGLVSTFEDVPVCINIISIE